MGKLSAIGKYDDCKFVFTDKSNQNWLFEIKNPMKFNEYGLIFSESNTIDKLKSSVNENNFDALLESKFDNIVKNVLKSCEVEVNDLILTKFKESKLFTQFKRVNNPILIKAKIPSKKGGAISLQLVDRYESRVGYIFFKSDPILEENYISELIIDDNVINDMEEQGIIIKYRELIKYQIAKEELTQEQYELLRDIFIRFSAYDCSNNRNYIFKINPQVLTNNAIRSVNALGKYLLDYVHNLDELKLMLGEHFDEKLHLKSTLLPGYEQQENKMMYLIKIQLNNIADKEVTEMKVNDIIKYLLPDIELKVTREVIDFNRL